MRAAPPALTVPVGIHHLALMGVDMMPGEDQAFRYG
jgi:hypothetical protein